jgi:hypothetical protein
MIMLTDTNQLETNLTNPAGHHLVKHSNQSFEHNFKYQCFSEINIFKGHKSSKLVLYCEGYCVSVT